MYNISKWILELQVAVVSTLRNYMIFSKSAAFISVLISSNSLLWQTVIVISYIIDKWEDVGLFKATLIVNIQDGLTGVMILVLAHISSALSGAFAMVLLSSFASVIGLLLLWQTNMFPIIYVVVVLLAIGKAGLKPLFKAFFADQLRTSDERLNREEERFEARTNFWWGFWYFVGFLVAIFGVGIIVSDWPPLFEITTIIMAVGVTIFLLGFTFYHHERPIGSPLTTLYRVLKAAISKKGLPYPDNPSAYYMNDSNNVIQLSPQSRFLRWLDKAAVIRTGPSSLSLEEEETKGELCTVTQVKEVKLLLRTVPMWATFLVYCLASATGNTFFFEQATNLNDEIVNDHFTLPCAFFSLVQSFSGYAILYLLDLIAKRWPSVRSTRVQIGLGMLSSHFSCIAARFVEVQRLKLVAFKKFEDKTDSDSIISMSVFWLTPQFCLLGFAEGLVEGGLAKFFYDQVGESMKRYGIEFSEFVLGIGKFVSIFLLLIFKSWIGHTINKSRLDKYYSVLAIAVIGSLFLFWHVSRMYNFMKVEEEQEEANLKTMVENV